MKVTRTVSLLIGCIAGLGFFTGCPLPMQRGTALYTANQEVQLLHIRSDVSNVEYDFRLGLDSDGRVTEIHYSDTENHFENYEVGKLETGIVLMRRSGKDVVSIIAKGVDTKSGGPVSMHYLYSAISGEYRSFEMEIDREGAEWKAYHVDASGRHAFRNLFFHKNEAFLVGVVGISSIEAD